MMKVMSIFLAISFFINVFNVSVKADETNAEYYISNIEIVNIEEEGLQNAFTFYSQADQKSYFVKSYENKTIIFELETNSLLTELIVTQDYMVSYSIENLGIPGVIPLATPDDYEAWGAYSYYQTSSLHIGDLEGWTISTIAGALTGAFGAFIGPITGLATIIYNKRYEGVDAKIYNSSNVYCPILIKQRYDFYPDGNRTNLLDQEFKTPTFWGSPIDFTQPYACRVLDQRY
ncbi:MAG: hypothetical protein ACI4U3_03380 [Traorella sp.]